MVVLRSSSTLSFRPFSSPFLDALLLVDDFCKNQIQLELMLPLPIIFTTCRGERDGNVRHGSRCHCRLTCQSTREECLL